MRSSEGFLPRADYEFISVVEGELPLVTDSGDGAPPHSSTIPSVA